MGDAEKFALLCQEQQAQVECLAELGRALADLARRVDALEKQRATPEMPERLDPLAPFVWR